MKTLFILSLTIFTLFATPNEDLIIKKHNTSIKRVKELEKIVKLSRKYLDLKKIDIFEYILWVNRLYKERLKKLNLEYEFRVKSHPNIKNPVDFEESINYASTLLYINILRVSVLEKPLTSIKKLSKRDYEILKFEISDIYDTYIYALNLYRYHSKQKIPYKLPKDITESLKKINH